MLQIRVVRQLFGTASAAHSLQFQARLHRGPDSRPSHGQGQLGVRSGCLCCPEGTWEGVGTKKRGGPEKGGRERGRDREGPETGIGGGGKGGKEGIKGMEKEGWRTVHTGERGKQPWVTGNFSVVLPLCAGAAHSPQH